MWMTLTKSSNIFFDCCVFWWTVMLQYLLENALKERIIASFFVWRVHNLGQGHCRVSWGLWPVLWRSSGSYCQASWGPYVYWCKRHPQQNQSVCWKGTSSCMLGWWAKRPHPSRCCPPSCCHDLKFKLLSITWTLECFCEILSVVEMYHLCVQTQIIKILD